VDLYTTIESPIGDLLLTSDGERLTGLQMSPFTVDPTWTHAPEALEDAAAQLEAYFAGELRAFDLDLTTTGTPFQRRVWHALADIPYGETISYGELARWIKNPRAVRAVGRANGANPIAIVLPCHRVIGSNGTLTGYGGGLDRKAKLLALEGIAVAI
jgi:methylated-DNA-[protein]-cysteine S-methyltransferase